MDKKYNEFWNDKELEISSNENENKKNKKKTMPRKKSETIEKEKIVVTQENNIEPATLTPTTQSLKQIYQQYVIDGTPYKIYSKGLVIFDSVNHKMSPEFYDDYFILFGNKYIYKGIRFEKY